MAKKILNHLFLSRLKSLAPEGKIKCLSKKMCFTLITLTDTIWQMSGNYQIKWRLFTDQVIYIHCQVWHANIYEMWWSVARQLKIDKMVYTNTQIKILFYGINNFPKSLTVSWVSESSSAVALITTSNTGLKMCSMICSFDSFLLPTVLISVACCRCCSVIPSCSSCSNISALSADNSLLEPECCSLNAAVRGLNCVKWLCLCTGTFVFIRGIQKCPICKSILERAKKTKMCQKKELSQKNIPLLF